MKDKYKNVVVKKLELRRGHEDHSINLSCLHERERAVNSYYL